MGSGFVFLWDSCVCECVSLSVYAFVCFVLFELVSFHFILSYNTSFNSYSLNACLFSKKKQKGC